MTDDITALRAALTHGSRSLIWDACNPDRIARLLDERDRLVAENARLLDRLDAAERDAARYRWLRDVSWTTSAKIGDPQICAGDMRDPESITAIWGNDADAAIDAAMQHTEGEK